MIAQRCAQRRERGLAKRLEVHRVAPTHDEVIEVSRSGFYAYLLRHAGATIDTADGGSQ